MDFASTQWLVDSLVKDFHCGLLQPDVFQQWPPGLQQPGLKLENPSLLNFASNMGTQYTANLRYPARFFLKKSWLDLACILKVLKYPCKVSPENVNSNQLAKPHGIPMGHVHSPLTILINILHTPVVRELFPILHPSQNWGIPCTAIGCPIVWKGITWKVRLSWMITWGETQAINKEKMSNPVDLNAVISIIYTILSY